MNYTHLVQLVDIQVELLITHMVCSKSSKSNKYERNTFLSDVQSDD